MKINWILITLLLFSVFAYGDEVNYEFACANKVIDGSIENNSSDFDKHTSTRANLWEPGQTINIFFLDGNNGIQDYVISVAKRWTNYHGVNLKFNFFKRRPSPEEKSDIRITFNQKGNWSKIGRTRPSNGSATMSLEDVKRTNISTDSKNRVILHEFGHAIGLFHEHQNPNFKYTWNVPFIIKYCKDTWKFDEKECKDNVIADLDTSSTKFSTFDENSVMLYSFPKDFTEEGWSAKANYYPSSLDVSYLQLIYGTRKDTTQRVSVVTGEDGKLKNIGDIRIKKQKSPFFKRYERNIDLGWLGNYKKLKRLKKVVLKVNLPEVFHDIKIEDRIFALEYSEIEVIVNGKKVLDQKISFHQADTRLKVPLKNAHPGENTIEIVARRGVFMLSQFDLFYSVLP